ILGSGSGDGGKAARGGRPHRNPRRRAKGRGPGRGSERPERRGRERLGQIAGGDAFPGAGARADASGRKSRRAARLGAHRAGSGSLQSGAGPSDGVSGETVRVLRRGESPSRGKPTLSGSAGQVQGPRRVGARSASASAARKRRRGQASAPNRDRCSVSIWQSINWKFQLTSRSASWASATLDASGARANMLSPKKAAPSDT